MFERVLIANRGEIACRIIRTCRRLGIHTIAVYSEADQNAQHVRQADEAHPIGGSAPADSYLRIDTIVEVARATGAEAIHPGYGFLSENTDFARACSHAGVVFIGPDPESVEAMGSKAAAKALMEKHDVPLVPGYHGDDQSDEALAREADKTGYPLMIKPAAGGGGKGMRIVRQHDDFADALAAAQRESKGAFGDSRVILERYVEHPRHIEFQVFGDREGHIIHLNERECSSQRRYQKVLEETPSPFLTPERRQAMGRAAVNAARAVDYVGAGTVEFIVGADGAFFFMEMNTRLQVEHPVTEMTLGLDLVEWQLRVAAGETLPLTQEQIPAQRGHAIEVRLYAEDPEQNFLPGSGKLEVLELPMPSAHVRIDGGVVEGDTVTIFYDPLIAKLIVHDVDRTQALERLRQALGDCRIVGPKSNVGFLERLTRHPVLVAGDIDSGYLDAHLDEFLATAEEPLPITLHAAACVALLADEDAATSHAAANDPHSPWARTDGWRIGPAGDRHVILVRGEQRTDIRARGAQGEYVLDHEDTQIRVRGARVDAGWLHACFDDTAMRLRVFAWDGYLTVHDPMGRRCRLQRESIHAWDTSEGAASDTIPAPMPGRIVLVKTAGGDQVDEGQELIIMESMKMELSLKAPRAGTIETVSANQGEFVEADAVLVRFEAE